VSISGFKSSISDSSIRAKPSIDEPSNMQHLLQVPWQLF
jgi:hypothetical protein